MRTLLSFSALFLSVLLLQLSSGGVGPLDALSGIALGFDTAQIGLLGSAHFLGFFIGCWWAPRLMGAVGHSRAFAAFTAAGSIGLLAHMMLPDPRAWAIMRVASGLCIAGCYTVIEAWLQSRVTNQTRGRSMGLYRLVDMSGALLAQLMIAVLPPASYLSYNLLAMICCAALLPLALTRVQQPDTPGAPRLRPLMPLRQSPLAALAVIVAALSAASFRMVGPVYAQEIGLPPHQIAWFLAAFVLGGAFAQFPVGWLADRIDRRWVLIWLSVAAIASSGIAVLAQNWGANAVFAAMLSFGFTTFPIYSVAAAHAHDFTADRDRVELSAALMFYFALGAIAAPYAASRLIDQFGPPAMFAMIAAAHLLLVIFGLSRMRVRATPQDRTRYIYAPRTTFQIGRLTGRQRQKRNVPRD